MAVPHAIADVVLPDIETVIAAVPADLVESEDELAARVRLAYAYTRSTRDVEAIEAAIGILRARVAGDMRDDPFGPRVHAESFADARGRSRTGRSTRAGWTWRPRSRSCSRRASIAATQGRRLILFLGAQQRDPARDVGPRDRGDRPRGDLASEPLRRGRDAADALVGAASRSPIGEGFRTTERALVGAGRRRPARGARRAARLDVDRRAGDAPASAGWRCATASIPTRPTGSPRSCPASRRRPDAERPRDRRRRPRRSSPAGSTGCSGDRSSEEDAAGKGLRIPLALSLARRHRRHPRVRTGGSGSGSRRPRGPSSVTRTRAARRGRPSRRRRRASAGSRARWASCRRDSTSRRAVGRRGVIDDLAELGARAAADQRSAPRVDRSSTGSSGRCSATRGWARSSSRRCRSTSMPAATVARPPAACTSPTGRSPIASSAPRTCLAMASTASRAGGSTWRSCSGGSRRHNEAPRSLGGGRLGRAMVAVLHSHAWSITWWAVRRRGTGWPGRAGRLGVVGADAASTPPVPGGPSE